MRMDPVHLGSVQETAMKTAVTLALFLTAAPAFAGDKAIIQALEDKFSAAASRGDADALAAMYAPDATILPPGSDPVHGRAGAKVLFAGLAKGVDKVKLTTTDVVRLSPDYIREVGLSEVHDRGAAASTTTTYAVVWKRVNGKWELWTDIFH